MSWVFAAALTSGFLLSATSQADDGPATRPCTTADLSGTYVLVDFRELHGNVFSNTVAVFPYQFLGFFSDGRWSKMGFNNAPTTADAVSRTLALPGQIGFNRYSLQPQGTIAFNTGAKTEFVGRCSVSLKSINGVEKDDLILSGGEGGTPAELHGLFRRWTTGPAIRAVSSFDPDPAASQRPSPSVLGAATSPPPSPPQAPTQEGSAGASLPASAPAAAAGPDGGYVSEADIQPTLPDDPPPIVAGVHDNGTRDGGEKVWITVTNASHAPLSAFMVVYRTAATGGQWRDAYVDACVDHKAAWQPGQTWTTFVGIRIAVRAVQAFAGAALFADGSTWGNPQRLAQLKAHHGTCQWPGS